MTFYLLIKRVKVECSLPYFLSFSNEILSRLFLIWFCSYFSLLFSLIPEFIFLFFVCFYLFCLSFPPFCPPLSHFEIELRFEYFVNFLLFIIIFFNFYFHTAFCVVLFQNIYLFMVHVLELVGEMRVCGGMNVSVFEVFIERGYCSEECFEMIGIIRRSVLRIVLCVELNRSHVTEPHF